MLYRLPRQTATPVVIRAEAPRISGHKVARRVAGKSQAERAATAANLYLRGFTIRKPTIKQLAAVCGVSATYVHAALKLSPGELTRVGAGHRPMVEAKPSSKALADVWANATASEREAFVETAGVGSVWNAIEKVIA